jgi:hypothetical protein
MKKVIIKNLDGVQTHGAEMEDPTQWIADSVASNAWGLPEEYTVEIVDITAQVEQDKVNAEALAYLASTDWMIIREVDSGVLCPSDVKLARAQARAKIVR